MERINDVVAFENRNSFGASSSMTDRSPRKAGLHLQLIGLGDVGGTLLTGLVLLGGGLIADIGIYDPDHCRVSRYEQEMNQILPSATVCNPRVYPLSYDMLFHRCDGMIFTASAGVPPLGSGVKDVRMAQLEKNRAILRPYGQLAVDRNYSGWFFQVSDPVDLLCHCLKETGVAANTIVGCGLGVMFARANYLATQYGVSDFNQNGRVYGPHGAGLIVANDIGQGYDEALSQTLTKEVLSANLAVRETGYKPYIAPGLSSGCITILRALRGEWFDGCVYMDNVFFGCRVRITDAGIQREPLPQLPALRKRIDETLALLFRQTQE